jgi:hypothetical protein
MLMMVVIMLVVVMVRLDATVLGIKVDLAGPRPEKHLHQKGHEEQGCAR